MLYCCVLHGTKQKICTLKMAARLIHTGCSVTNSDPQNDCAFDIEKIAQTFLCVSTFPFFAVGHLKLDIGGNCDVLSIIVK